MAQVTTESPLSDSVTIRAIAWEGGHVILHATPQWFASRSPTIPPTAIDVHNSILPISHNMPQQKTESGDFVALLDGKEENTALCENTAIKEEQGCENAAFEDSTDAFHEQAKDLQEVTSGKGSETLSIAEDFDSCNGIFNEIFSEDEDIMLAAEPPVYTAACQIVSEDVKEVNSHHDIVIDDQTSLEDLMKVSIKEDAAKAENVTLEMKVLAICEANSGMSPSAKKSPSLDKGSDYHYLEKKPTNFRDKVWLFLQIFIPYLFAGVGTCATGLLLDFVQHWKVFHEIPQLFILVPPLLGLKGNLGMTLAARLSTQVNLGNLEEKHQQWKASWGNTVLIVCQAIVVGFLAAGFAVVAGLLQDGISLDATLVLTAGCMATSVLPTLLLAVLTIKIVILAPRLGIDPDNVATPVAASLGDLTTLAVLAYSSHGLHNVPGYLVKMSVCGGIVAACVLMIPVLFYLSYRNSYSHQVLKTGWVPVISSVIITSGGGAILEKSVKSYSGLAIFQPVINGLGGNLVSIHASRASTSLHQGCLISGGCCVSPFTVFFSSSVQSFIARMLMLMVIPGHVIFAYALHLLRGSTTEISNPFFLPIYLGAAFIQVAILIYSGSLLVRMLWRMGADPDNSAIPLLTALGDLLGSLFLAVAFYFFYTVVVVAV